MKQFYLLLLFSLFTGISAFSQITVQGTVTDQSTGETLAGVNVLIKGTTRGTITDIDGRYTLEANTGDELIFSFIGYITKELVVGGSELNVTLEPDVTNLEEVVIPDWHPQ